MAWMYVRKRFRLFVDDLTLTANQLEDGAGKFQRIAAIIQAAYHEGVRQNFDALMVGSWGKKTQIRPPRDLDMFAVLPWEVKARFDARSGNVQSQLLQEVKSVLTDEYGQTDIRGDGQVVSVGFNNITVEIVPVFLHGNGQYTMPDTNGGGSWKLVDPAAQIDTIDGWDALLNGNIRALSRMIKLWKHEQNVPIKSFIIELLVAEFLPSRANNNHDAFWYDFYCRDFFGFLVSKANQYLLIPGTAELYPLGSDWLAKAQAAHQHAIDACSHEIDDLQFLAGEEWRNIFGSRVPLTW